MAVGLHRQEWLVYRLQSLGCKAIFQYILQETENPSSVASATHAFTGDFHWGNIPRQNRGERMPWKIIRTKNRIAYKIDWRAFSKTKDADFRIGLGVFSDLKNKMENRENRLAGGL